MYLAMPVEDSGIPMIPDNGVFSRALTAFIKAQYFTILFDMGKISSQSLQQALQDYAWAVGACESEFLRLDLGRAESFFNSFRTLIVRDSEFENGFKENGTKELINRH
mgnify:CR=1 FL=1